MLGKTITSFITVIVTTFCLMYAELAIEAAQPEPVMEIHFIECNSTQKQYMVGVYGEMPKNYTADYCSKINTMIEVEEQVSVLFDEEKAQTALGFTLESGHFFW